MMSIWSAHGRGNDLRMRKGFLEILGVGEFGVPVHQHSFLI